MKLIRKQVRDTKTTKYAGEFVGYDVEMIVNEEGKAFIDANLRVLDKGSEITALRLVFNGQGLIYRESTAKPEETMASPVNMRSLAVRFLKERGYVSQDCQLMTPSEVHVAPSKAIEMALKAEQATEVIPSVQDDSEEAVKFSLRSTIPTEGPTAKRLRKGEAQTIAAA